MLYDWPEEMVRVLPSCVRMVMRPETAYPTCEFWHDSVFTTGLMHSDHRHPASNMKRQSVWPCRRSTSTRVMAGMHSSGAGSWDYTSIFGTATGVSMTY